MKKHSWATIDLSPGERLWLWRKRKGWTVEQARAKYDASEDMFLDWEHDARTDAPNVRVSPPMGVEWLRLYRRRKGWTLAELARKIGVTKLTILKWEKGEWDSERLRLWWQKQLP